MCSRVHSSSIRTRAFNYFNPVTPYRSINLYLNSVTLENCLPAMEYLLGLFEEAKIRYRDDPFMAYKVNSAWPKLDKYYTKTNDSAAYIAALVLDPCMKLEYITSTWQPEWIPVAKALVVKLWKKYRPTDPIHTHVEETVQDPKHPRNEIGRAHV